LNSKHMIINKKITAFSCCCFDALFLLVLKLFLENLKSLLKALKSWKLDLYHVIWNEKSNKFLIFNRARVKFHKSVKRLCFIKRINEIFIVLSSHYLITFLCCYFYDSFLFVIDLQASIVCHNLLKKFLRFLCSLQSV